MSLAPQQGVLAIVGAGGHAKVAADIAELSGWLDIRFFEDDPVIGRAVGSSHVFGAFEELFPHLVNGGGAFVAIGDPTVRRHRMEVLRARGVALPSLVHPDACISRYASYGAGCLINAGVIVNAASSIGFGVILNTGCRVGHDCEVMDYAHVAPGAVITGGVTVGESAWVGASSTIVGPRRVGAGSVVGAGAVVLSDVATGQTVVGVPARVLSPSRGEE